MQNLGWKENTRWGGSVYVEGIFVAEGIQSGRITEETWKCCRIAANCDMVYC